MSVIQPQFHASQRHKMGKNIINICLRNLFTSRVWQIYLINYRYHLAVLSRRLSLIEIAVLHKEIG